jgi:hypothetical protein
MMADAVVRAWMQAFEARDAERLVALTSPELDYTRWRGVERGHDAVRRLLDRQTYGVAMYPKALRWFRRDDTVVVEVRIVGRYVDTGKVAEVDHGAGVFVVRDGLVARYAPLPSLAQALAYAGLDEGDQIAD